MKYFGRAVLFILAFGIGVMSFRYLNFEPQGILAGKGTLLQSSLYLTAFYLHVFLGTLALLTGPFQWLTKFKSAYRMVHRTLGLVYIFSCVVSGVAAFYIAFFADGGWIASLGFICLAVFWLFTTLRAYYEVRTGSYQAHRFWMLRSYALTFAAVTLRIWLPVLLALGIAFTPAYQIISWWCWVPNLILIELIIRIRLAPRGELPEGI